MAATRLARIHRKVELELDGARIEAECGEPLAFALIAADKLPLSRGPKLHRPRGPYCLRGGCDGCALRVNGEPNVLTCLVAVRGGERVSSQNVLGSREVDLLQVTDWFFPQGFDHHHLLTGIPSASPVLARLARHVAGLGRMPDGEVKRGSASRKQVDVLVVGGGPAGLLAARGLAEAEPALRVLLVDDGVSLGGSLRARLSPQAVATATAPFGRAIPTLSQTSAVGIYDGEVLLTSGVDASVVQARAVVLATGTHDGIVPFANNDLPGVMSARAGALLAAHGIAIGERVGLLGSGPYLDAFVANMVGHRSITTVALPSDAAITATGRSRIRQVQTDGGARHQLDALLVETRGSPSFELAQQAGASITHDATRGGYLPSVDPCGRALPWLWCAGELAGTGPRLEAIEAQARAVTADVLSALAVG